MPIARYRQLTIFWLVLATLGFFTAPAGADIPISYRFSHLTTADGLSQGVVSSIHQDIDGFVWLATEDGLNRYDGSHFEVYTNDLDNPRSLASNGIWCIDVDSQGRVWYGTEDAGFGFYDPNSADFTNFRFDPNSEDSLEAYEVNDLKVHPDNSVWLATSAHGVIRFDYADSSITSFVPGGGDLVQVPTLEIWTVTVDHSGQVWAGTSEGLVCFDQNNKPARVYQHAEDDSTSLADDFVYRLYPDAQNCMWVGTSDGLDVLDLNTHKFKHYNSKSDDLNTLSNPSISGIAEDQDGRIWVATMPSGINVLDRISGKVQRLKHDPLNPYSLANNSCNNLVIDNNGLLWVASQKGASILDLYAKDFLHLAPGKLDDGFLQNPTVWSMAEDKNSDIWVGTEDGLHHYNPSTNKMRVFTYDPNDTTSVCNSTFTFVKSDSRGELWIGSDMGGLSRYNFERDNFLNYGEGVNGPPELSLLRYYGFSEGPDGTVWLATMSGLFQHDATADTFIVHTADSTGVGLSASQLRSVHADSYGYVWVSTWFENVERYDPRTGVATSFKHNPADPTSISNNVIICFMEDSRKNTWMGTGNGLNVFHHETGLFERFGTKDGLPNATIYGMLEAPDGAIWVSTNRGISRFDPVSHTFDNYDVTDGLQDNEFNSQSCFLGASGHMYFGGINGVTFFKPDAITNSTLQPKLAVTNLQLLNRSVPVGADADGRVLLTQPVHRTKSITLKPSDRVVTLEFSAFDYAAPQGINFAYKLVGFDADWHHVGDRRDATYTNLQPGNYTFRVRATNHDGVWSPHEASLSIAVPPPFWRTIWFMILAAGVVLGLMRVAYAYRTRMMRELNKELEQKVTLRTSDLQQEIVERKRAEEQLQEATNEALAATQAKSEFLANMSHEMRTPLNGVIGLSGAMLDTALDQDQLEYCQMVQSSANALLNVINDVLDFSKMEVGKLDLDLQEFHLRDTVDEIGDMLSWQAYEKGLVFAGVVDARVPAVYTGDSCRIRQVLLNLVGNAVKFTAEGSVEVRVTTTDTDTNGKCVVRWEVNDTGVGIPEDMQHRLFHSFSQVDASTTRRYGGTGLGLAISKQLVELMDGTIGCKSSDGAGACFWFETPLDVVAETHFDSSTMEPERPIMVISCVDLEREVLVNHLDHICQRNIAAKDTESAVKLLCDQKSQGNNLSAIIVGRLPGLEDPADLIHHLFGTTDVENRVPLILLSDLGDRMDRNQLHSKGYQASLTSPVKHRRLFQVLDELVGSKPEPCLPKPAQKTTADVQQGIPHILLAEDNAINQRVAGLILTKLGFTYDVVGTGIAAVMALSEIHYDAVLMDVQMPEMDGLEATQAIRDKSSTALNPQVPILAMTAHAMASDRQRCLEAGMNEHLTKPIQGDLISKALDKYLAVTPK